METLRNKITLNLDKDAKVSVEGFIAPIEYTEHDGHVKWEALAKLRVAEPEKQYPTLTFQSFFPSKSVSVGDLWQIEEEGILELLRQLHPNPDLETCDSRGLWACLRAYNDEIADVAFRMHAEFDLAEGRFTPSQFAGNLIINRIKEEIVFFHMSVPDGTLNFNAIKWTGETYKGRPVYSADIGFCPQMELRVGTETVLQDPKFTEAITQAEVEHKLMRCFYKSQQINWVPLEEALGLAQVQQKPIHVVSVDGPLADEAC